MTSLNITVRPEEAADTTAIDQVVSTVFGPGMRARAAYALRENVPHERSLSFVAEHDRDIVGSVRLTKFMWGEDVALMLGPLAVLKEHSGVGVGKALMAQSIETAKKRLSDHGCEVVMLVGDLPYYKPFGFKRIAQGKIELPRPADPYRVLACELVADCLPGMSGKAMCHIA